MSQLGRQLDNYFATIQDLASAADEWRSRPSWLEFAPNNVCNLRCIMCGQADGLPVIAMKRDEARALLGQILPDATIWTPSALSEPLLADFRMVLEECRKHDVFLNMYTNATLTTGAKFREMADRLHKLYISFDSHIPEVFERFRAGAKFDTVVQNIKEIIPIAAELKIPIGFVVVLMPDTLAKLPEYIDFIADLGGAAAHAEIRAQPMLDNSAACDGLRLQDGYSDEEICSILDKAGERAMERKVIFWVDGQAPYRRQFSPVAPFMRGVTADVQNRLSEYIREEFPQMCYMAATYMKIEPDGDVFPCCRGPKDLKMGNFNESTIEEIWNGPAYRELRRRMMDKDYPDVCKTCDMLVGNPKFQQEWLREPSRG